MKLIMVKIGSANKRRKILSSNVQTTNLGYIPVTVGTIPQGGASPRSRSTIHQEYCLFINDSYPRCKALYSAWEQPNGYGYTKRSCWILIMINHHLPSFAIIDHYNKDLQCRWVSHCSSHDEPLSSSINFF